MMLTELEKVSLELQTLKLKNATKELREAISEFLQSQGKELVDKQKETELTLSKMIFDVFDSRNLNPEEYTIDFKTGEIIYKQ